MSLWRVVPSEQTKQRRKKNKSTECVREIGEEVNKVEGGRGQLELDGTEIYSKWEVGEWSGYK